MQEMYTTANEGTQKCTTCNIDKYMQEMYTTANKGTQILTQHRQMYTTANEGV